MYAQWKKTTDSNAESTETDTSDDTENSSSNTQIVIPEEYWGSWIRMDTGAEIYIDNMKIYKSSSSNKKSEDSSLSYKNLTFDGDNVLCNGNIRYFRKGGSARNFSVSVSGFSDARSAISTQLEGVTAKRKNKNNDADEETVVSNSEGLIVFSKSVANDTQTISLTSSNEEASTIDITPQYDGDYLGTIPLIEAGSYGFKSTYSIDSNSLGFCFGNYYKVYTLKLNLKNIGEADCAASYYQISSTDSKLSLSGSVEGNFSTTKAGSENTIELKVCYGQIDTEYVDVPVNIAITDRKYERTWNDAITLRFYKGTYELSINARNFNTNSRATLNGFCIYPDGRSQRFTVADGKTEKIYIPWSEKDYILAFSGATAETEMCYSFGFTGRTSLANINGVWSVDDMNAYKTNTASDPYVVSDLSKPVKAYLGDGDLEFYKINIKDVEIDFKPVAIYNNSISDPISTEAEYNNGDNKVNAGEVINIDVRLKNAISKNVSGISAVLSTTSKYVTVNTSEKTYGNIASGYYKTCHDTTETTGTNGYGSTTNYSSSSSSYSYLKPSDGFKFTVSSTCPDDTEIPFTLTMTDSIGNVWTDTFTIKVEKLGAEIKYYNYQLTSGGDSKVSSGESVNIDVRLKNSGSSKVLGLVTKLSTTSSYVTINTSEKTYGNIAGGCYKTCHDTTETTGTNGYGSTTNSSTSSSSYSYLKPSDGFKFTVSNICPAGAKLPFTLTMTDSIGNTWTDTFTITTE